MYTLLRDPAIYSKIDPRMREDQYNDIKTFIALVRLCLE